MGVKVSTRGNAIEPVHLNNLMVGVRGWGVQSGLTVSERGAGANMSVDVASGVGLINNTTVTKSSTTNVAITVADATFDRFDLVVINSSGTISVIDGTAGSPSFANDYDLVANNAILLAEVFVPATDTTIEDAQITDFRNILEGFTSSIRDHTGKQYATIAEAITALGTDGGTIFIPPGTYDERISIAEDNIILQGSGHATIIHEIAEIGTMILVLGDNCQIRDLRTYTTTGGAGGHGIQVNGVFGILDNVWVSSSDNQGVRLQGIKCRIVDCIIENTDGHGVAISSIGDEAMVNGTIIDTVGDDGIFIDPNGENCMIDGNRITNYTNEAIDDDSGTSTIGDNETT